VVKAIKLEQCVTRASIPRVVHSTEAVVEHIVEMIGWSARNGTKVKNTKEEV